MPMKVTSLVRGFEQDNDPYCIRFDRSDEVLRDPYLFSDIEFLHALTPNLLNYEKEMFPAIETPRPIYRLVDDEDYFYSGSLGLHHTIATVGRQYDSVQVILGGDFLSDSLFQRLNSHPPSEKSNHKFAESLVRMLTETGDTPHRREKEAYSGFASLERKLGEFISLVIKGKPVSRTIPEKILSKLTNERGDVDFSSAYFADLVTILSFDDNWAIACLALPEGLSKTKMKKRLNSFNAGNRRYLAHPSRTPGGTRYSDEDLEEIKDLFNIFANAVTAISRALVG